jgi:hypothetical protein
VKLFVTRTFVRVVVPALVLPLDKKVCTRLVYQYYLVSTLLLKPTPDLGWALPGVLCTQTSTQAQPGWH